MATIDDIATFCKRKGFIYPNSEIYGGMAGFFDYGHLGVELKQNIKSELWKRFVKDNIVGIDGSIITNPKVWEASGHVSSFSDIMLICKKCKTKIKAEQADKKCKCGGDFEKQEFNLLFETNIGPGKESKAYLRPETAQLIFTNFKLVMDNARQKLPFGIAQFGKAFRNEISPRDFLFRTREFEMFEIEFFVHPEKINEAKIDEFEINFVDQKDKAKKIKIKKLNTNMWHIYWLSEFYKFFLDFGIKKENLRIRQHKNDELAHYAKSCFDIEYKFPFGWKEIHGNADRQQFDLNQHIKFSKTDLSVYDEETKKKIVPYVASEPSQGIDRAFLAFMFEAYEYDKQRENIVLKLHPKLAPIKVGVFPLVSNKPEIVKRAREIYDDLKKDFTCKFDLSASIGRRYSRADEEGTFLCCTIDFESLNDNCVTLRDRDTTKQIRVKISEVKDVVRKLIEGEKFEDCGKVVK